MQPLRYSLGGFPRTESLWEGDSKSFVKSQEVLVPNPGALGPMVMIMAKSIRLKVKV